MWYVYILRSIKDNNLYIGSTNNVEVRLKQHNSGEVTSTKSRIPFTLETYFAVKNKEIAIKLEQYFKTGSGYAVLRKRFL